MAYARCCGGSAEPELQCEYFPWAGYAEGGWDQKQSTLGAGSLGTYRSTIYSPIIEEGCRLNASSSSTRISSTLYIYDESGSAIYTKNIAGVSVAEWNVDLSEWVGHRVKIGIQIQKRR